MDPLVFKDLEEQYGVELGEYIGGGGFGDVYGARVNDVSCAIKISRDKLDLARGWAAKELQGLKLVKSISGHPHIVTLFDIWKVRGHLVTRWELGQQSLSGRLEECREQKLPAIPRGELLAYMEEAAEAVDFLNEQGIHHRDLKPENLLLFRGHLKVADLGLAKFVGASSASHTGSGTLGYIPPEGHEGRLTHSSDLYSLAATYVRLRTGRAPFGTNANEIIQRQQAERPILDGLDPTETKAVRRALSRRPEDRPQDTAVEWVKSLVRKPTPSEPPRQIRPQLWVAVVLMLGIVVGGIGVAVVTNQIEGIGSVPVGGVSAMITVPTMRPVGMQLVLIPAGEFMMGSSESPEALAKAFEKYDPQRVFFEDERPQHDVRISKPFYLGMHEVTVGQFRRFVEYEKYKTDAEKDGAEYTWRNPGFKQDEDHPVVYVSWNDAVAFCQWLSRKEGRQYRLPTEAEWEYACRAGSTTRWCFGNSESELGEYACWYSSNSAGKTHAVGQKKPNAWDLYDMHGKVYEWCQDRYDINYYANSPMDDPPGPTTGSVRVLRGGGWSFGPGVCRSAIRSRDAPDGRFINLGFRVALVPVDASSR